MEKSEQAGKQRRGEVDREQQGNGGGGESEEVREEEQRGQEDTKGRARARDVMKGRRNITPQKGLPHLASPFSLSKIHQKALVKKPNAFSS